MRLTSAKLWPKGGAKTPTEGVGAASSGGVLFIGAPSQGGLRASTPSAARVDALWSALARRRPVFTVSRAGGDPSVQGVVIDDDPAALGRARAAIDGFAPEIAVVADAGRRPDPDGWRFAAKRRIYAPCGDLDAVLAAGADALDGFSEIWVRTEAEVARIGRRRGVVVRVAPDPADQPEAPSSSDGALAAALVDRPLTSPQAAALARLAAIMAEQTPGVRILATPVGYAQLTQHGLPPARLALAASTDALIDGAAVGLHAGDPGGARLAASLRSAGAVAVSTETLGETLGLEARLVRAAARATEALSAAAMQDAGASPGGGSGDAGPAPDNALDAAIAEALGGGPDDIGEETAQDAADRLRRTLGLRVEMGGFFNPFTRLLDVSVTVHGGGPLAERLDGDLLLKPNVRNGAPLSNAWVQKPDWASGAGVLLKAVAALPEDVTPRDLTITIDLDGLEMMRVDMPIGLSRQNAGLVTAELQDQRFDVYAWSDRPFCDVQIGKRTLRAEAADATLGAPYLVRASGAWPLDRNSVQALPRRGVGQRFVRMEPFYDDPPVSSARFAAMRGKHAGRRAWLVGNGPSVRLEDLDRLAGEVAFCFNRFHLAHNDTKLRATYTVTGDQQMIEDFGEQIVAESGGDVLVASDAPPRLTGRHCWIRQVVGFPSLFSTDASRQVWPGGSSVYAAMQIGWFLGIREFYLYGADFKFNFQKTSNPSDRFRTASGDGNHFIKNYRSGRDWCPPSLQNILSSFLAARLFLEAQGGFVKNATRGGEMEVFDRIDFDAAVDAPAEAFDRTDD